MADDREELLNELTGAEPAEPHAEAAPPEPAVPEEKPAAEAETPFESGEAKALLDSLTVGAPAEKQGEEAKPAEAAKPEEKPADAAAKPADDADMVIAEVGVKSERGQNRIREIVARSKEAEAKAQEFEANITEFRDMIRSTGMPPEQFAQTLEFGRLVNSGDEANLRVALEMIEQQRTEIAKRLGIEVPGVDPLADFPELKQAVENMEITPAYAAQLAKVKRQEQVQQQARQAEQRSQQDIAEYQQAISQVQQTAEAYFATRAHESDHQAKLNMIGAKFKEPGYIQEFVATYEPKQWFGILKMMYDTMVVPQPAAPRDPQPLRGRPANTGTPASNNAVDNSTRLFNVLDSMGI